MRALLRFYEMDPYLWFRIQMEKIQGSYGYTPNGDEEGSVFWVDFPQLPSNSLPLSMPQAIADKNCADKKEIDANETRALVIDDSAITRAVICDILTRNGIDQVPCGFHVSVVWAIIHDFVVD